MEKQKDKSFQINGINPEVFKLFKIACIRSDLDMRDAIINFMQDFGKNERKKNE